MVGPVDKDWSQMMRSYSEYDVSRPSAEEEEEYEWLLGSPRSFLEEPLSHTWDVFNAEKSLSERTKRRDSIYTEVVELLNRGARVTPYNVQVICLLLVRGGFENEKMEGMLKLLHSRGIEARQLKAELQRTFPKNPNNLERLNALETYIDSLRTEGR